MDTLSQLKRKLMFCDSATSFEIETNKDRDQIVGMMAFDAWGDILFNIDLDEPISFDDIKTELDHFLAVNDLSAWMDSTILY